MEVLSYQPHSGKYTPFSRGGLLPTSSLRTPSSSNLAFRQSSIPDENKPSDDVSRLREVDDENGDENSDDELPSLQKLLSPTTPRTRLFKNVPAWAPCRYNPEIRVRPNIGNTQDNPVVIDDDNGDLTDRSNRIPHQMTVNDPGMEGKNTDGGVGSATHTGEVGADCDPDDTAMSQGDDRSVIATSAPLSPEIPESDCATTLDEERQLSPSVLGGLTPSPCNKRSRSLSGSGQADGRGSDWVFDVFAEYDGETEGDGLPSSKQIRSSPPPSKAAEDSFSPAAAVAAEGIQVAGNAPGDRLPGGDQKYEVQQIVGESGLEYEVTAITKISLPKAAVSPKLVKKYRAEQRATTRVRTRWSSRLRNK